MKKLMVALFGLVLVVSVIQFTPRDINAIEETTTLSSAGVNDDALNSIIETTLTDNAGTDWQVFLNAEFKRIQTDFKWATPGDGVPKWGGGIATDNTATGDPATTPSVYPTKNTEGAYEIYFPEQLALALSNPDVVEKNIILKNDMDMAGYLHNWTYTTRLENFTFNGNNHTIYNIGSQKSFIDSMKNNCVLKDVNFVNAKLVSPKTGTHLLGIVGDLTSEKDKSSSVTNVGIKNSLFFSSYPTYADGGSGPLSYVAPLNEPKYVTADRVTSENNIVFALKAHASAAFGVTEDSKIMNSYSINSTVIAGGNHSGGFISCSDGGNVISNSFTNNTVYGNEETGVFIGALMDNNSGDIKGDSFENCYSSGSIEGTSKLGGFVGHIAIKNYINSTKYSFKNCYSTSIVGMRKGGVNLGGFVGLVDCETTFTDCYSAGEVGAIDTDTSNSMMNANPTVGGFIGDSTKTVTYSNTYYDKQTSAMREWESGDTRDYLEVNDGVLNSEGLNNILGLKGVLTSDSAKFGSGLASEPKTGVATADFDKVVGFTGFTGDSVSAGTTNIVSNPNWIYDGGNTDPALHNCMYPQLKGFFENDDPLIRAFSYASVATVHEQVWDTCTHGKPLPLATYDTIRDLTSRFTLTSYVDNPKDAGKLHIDWKKNEVNSDIYNTQKPVIGLFTEVQSTKYNRPYWTADRFAPGTQWVKAEFVITQDNVDYVGSRRLRIIPTSNITPGLDQIDLVVGDTYNHAKDMYMAYSTAQRMAQTVPDITTGVYPDSSVFTPGDPRLLIQYQTPAIEHQFTLDTNNFIVGAEHMTREPREVDLDHPDNVVITYLYGVKSFVEVPGSDIAKIDYGTKEDAIISPAVLKGTDAERIKKAEEWQKKLTGQAPFELKDEGRYLIEYEWVLPDGRFMRDSKMIMVQDGKHNVTAEVRNSIDETLNNGSLKLSVDKFNYAEALPAPTFGDKTVSSAKAEAGHNEPVNIAFKDVNAGTTIDRIKFVFELEDIASSASTQTVIINDITVDEPFIVPVSYYYSSFEENGNYYAKKVSTEKSYTLKKDLVGGYYYLTLNEEFTDASTGLARSDVECDVHATIYVTDALAINTGSASVQTKTLEDGKLVPTSEKFQYRITGPDGYDETIEVSSKTDAIKTLNLKVGEYQITQLTNHGYLLTGVSVNGEASTDPYHFFVTTDQKTELIFTNEKNTSASAANILVETFFNKKQVYIDDPFTYQIMNSDGTIVHQFTLASSQDKYTRFELLPGTYTIVQLPKQGYTLDTMRFDDKVVMAEPFTFTIEKNSEMNIIIKNIVNDKALLPSDTNNPNTGFMNTRSILYLLLGLFTSALVLVVYLKQKMFPFHKH